MWIRMGHINVYVEAISLSNSTEKCLDACDLSYQISLRYRVHIMTLGGPKYEIGWNIHVGAVAIYNRLKNNSNGEKICTTYAHKLYFSLGIIMRMEEKASTIYRINISDLYTNTHNIKWKVNQKFNRILIFFNRTHFGERNVI